MHADHNRFSIPKVQVVALMGFLAANWVITSTHAEVSQSPLILGEGSVPGSLALVPSVEWPTILSVANLGSYSSANQYSGYFDSEKCYRYRYERGSPLFNYDNGTPLNNVESQTRTGTYFYPDGIAVNHACNQGGASKQWSGNFLNWVATTTIDSFRGALTGGNRIVDTQTLTVLQKARHDGHSDAGNRMVGWQGLLPTAEITKATPMSYIWGNVYIRLEGLYYDMLISSFPEDIGGDGARGEKIGAWVDYDENNSLQWNGGRLVPAYGKGKDQRTVYRMRLQVQACAPNYLETNCKRYGDGYKPEGLLQQYANSLRFSSFSYLNDSDPLRDGGVLRTNQKYIGPTLGVGGADNPAKEWSPKTGIFVANPNPDDASATGDGVRRSGVINYINQFGSVTDSPHKSNDPVSELYYSAIRYFKHLGNVPEYSQMQSDIFNTADGFPVLTKWEDPISYSCQKNIILGIGDVNTHNDKNLPGDTSSSDEPPKPDSVRSDKSVDVVAATARVGSLEGFDLRQNSSEFTGHRNSAYIAGLAYDSHTRDLRPDIAGRQTLSTYWVDVREDQKLAFAYRNQYWLAAKYGGFKVPPNFDPYGASTARIADNLWWTSGQKLESDEKRPDNFFVASDAKKMAESLKMAFSQMVQSLRSTTTSLATNSTQLKAGSAIFQSQFLSSDWSGDLLAKSISSDGVPSAAPAWSAAVKLDSLGDLADRRILTSRTLDNKDSGGYSISRSGVNFRWSELDDTSRSELKRTAGTVSLEDTTSLVSDVVGEQRLDYLRGDRGMEQSSDHPERPFRKRGSRMGDIINSDPLYIDKQDFGYNLLSGSQWGNAGPAYLDYRRSESYRARTPLVVVGANDGMLHAFNAKLESGGDELFAYVPRSILGGLYHLTEPAYQHRYYVDGPASFSDVYVSGVWKRMVVGTTGAGGRSVFALDVSEPERMGVNNVIWEFTAPDMGYLIQRPSIVALANGRFGVVVSSGFVNKSVTTGQVWILDAVDGSVIHKFSVATTGGMGEPLVADLNNDRVADRIYVGDTSGNVWRMDIADGAPSNWRSPASLGSGPLFHAHDDGAHTQPITAPLSVALNSDGSPLVLFGTGSFYQASDIDRREPPRIESFYGIVDQGSPVVRSDLLEQRILNQRDLGGNQLRVISHEAMTTENKGWYLDLQWKAIEGGSDTPNGERVISRSVLRGGSVTFNTLTPSSDPCSGGGTSWSMALDVLSGSRLTYNYFDANGDGALNDSDYYVAADGTRIPYSGSSDVQNGAVKTPSFFSRDDGDDLICFVGSAEKGPQCAPVPPGNRISGRISWREVNR